MRRYEKDNEGFSSNKLLLLVLWLRLLLYGFIFLMGREIT